MRLFSGTLNADGLPAPIEVKGSVSRYTFTDTRTDFKVFQFSGVLLAPFYSKPGFWDFELETDIGFRSFVRVTDAECNYMTFILRYLNVGSPIALPDDGSLGVL